MPEDDPAHGPSGAFGELQLVVHQHLRVGRPSDGLAEQDHRVGLGAGTEKRGIDPDGGLQRG